MSGTTPRKRRHRQPSNRIPAVSDYESDAATMHHEPPYAPPPPRSNTELNLGVLQRYLPSISKILSIAANAVVYTFDSGSQGWEKSGIEGTMFVCAQAAPQPQAAPRACVFILNRRGLDNVIVDLARVSHVEIIGELVILKVEGDWEQGEKVLGVWIHNDQEETRAINGAMIEECWKVARAAGTATTVTTPGSEAGPAMQAIGRPLTLDELFAKPGAAK